MKNRLIKAITLSFLAVAGLASCGVGGKSFSMSEDKITMEQYQEYALDLDLHNLEAGDIDYAISDYSIASVADGVVTSKATGRATITASYGSQSYSCSLVVTGAKTGRALFTSQGSLTLEVGESQKIDVELREAGEVVEGAEIVFESSLPDAIEVSQDGLIQGKARGNGIISAYCVYRGQRLTKDIPVSVKKRTHAASDLSFMDDDHAGSSLTLYNGDAESLGFAEEEKVYRLHSEGGYPSRIFDSNAIDGNGPKADRLAFRIRFDAEPSDGTAFYLSESRRWEGNASLLTSNTGFLFYDYRGRPAESFRLSKTYLIVINLRKIGQAEAKDLGFAFLGAADAYVGGAVLGSEDYINETYGLTPPEELPDLNYVYAETGEGLELGVEPIEAFSPYWIGYSSGTSGDWDDSIYSQRIAIGGVNYATYREYAYLEMGVIFTDVDFRSIAVWTGGYALFVSPTMAITSTETSTILEDDLTIYQGGEAQETGTAFQANVPYVFKIRIQKDNLENEAFGIAANSATKDPIYLGDPNLTRF